MRKLVESVLENHSTEDEFLFRVACANCGTEYGNMPIRFSKAGTTPTTKSEQVIYDSLYEKEFNAALQATIQSAAEHMNYCPICKRLVCNQCFLICDNQDMCRQCAEKLAQRGKPVLSGIRSTALRLETKVMGRSKQKGDFFICLLVNMLLNLEWSIPAWILLGLHLGLGISIWWFVGAMAVWIVGILISMWLIGWAIIFGNRKDPPRENKNPYSVKK